MKESGVSFHAKHAFMPNSLGYCGPDEKGRIQEDLELGKTSGRLVEALQKFEAAYPFLKLIAKSSGRDVFDYSVPEAYWIGNGLLERVPATEFYAFSHRDLMGKDPKKVRAVFKGLDGSAPPHHTFYVMSTYALSGASDGPDFTNVSDAKVAQLIDNCRISLGRVKEVGGREMQVEASSVVMRSGRLALSAPRLRQVRYNPDVRPFGAVRAGDMVSLHWGYACDVLSLRQAANLTRYTKKDLALANGLLGTAKARR